MNLRYLRKLHPILNKIGKKHNINIEEGEFIIGLFFKSLAKALNDPRLPKVILPLFGVFKPNIKYLNRSILQTINFHKNGGLTREYVNIKVRRLWKIKQRLIKEQNEETTWNEWQKKSKLIEFQKMLDEEQSKREKSRKEIFRSNNNTKKQEKLPREIQERLQSKRK